MADAQNIENFAAESSEQSESWKLYFKHKENSIEKLSICEKAGAQLFKFSMNCEIFKTVFQNVSADSY